MSSRRLYDKVMTIVGTLMIFFYLGLAYVLFFSNAFAHIEITMRVIFGTPLVMYAMYRIVLSYQKIKENFFEKDDE